MLKFLGALVIIAIFGLGVLWIIENVRLRKGDNKPSAGDPFE